MQSSRITNSNTPMSEFSAGVLKCLGETREDAVQNAIRPHVPLALTA